MLAGTALFAQDGGELRELPLFEVADAEAAPVTAANLLASERFWPYRVALTSPWQPENRTAPLPAGVAGVLIRVEESSEVRIDFGRDGLRTVPLEATDLLSRANALRLGNDEKMAPNLVLDLGPRLMDSGAEILRPLGLRNALPYRRFLCVFADPSAPDFAALARQLAPFRQRDGVLTVLLPLGDHPDAALRVQLRSLSWPVAFLMDRLAEPYAEALLPEGSDLPTLMLLTSEGRVLLGGAPQDVLERLAGRLPETASGTAEETP